MKLNLFVGIFCLAVALFIWLYLGIYKSVICWRREFGKPNWGLFTAEMFLGLMVAGLAALNFYVAFTN